MPSASPAETGTFSVKELLSMILSSSTGESSPDSESLDPSEQEKIPAVKQSNYSRAIKGPNENASRFGDFSPSDTFPSVDSLRA